MMEKLNGCISFIEDDELIEMYNSIWNRVSSSIRKELDCEPMYNKKTSENHNKVLWL